MLMGPVAMGQLGAVSFNPLNGTARETGRLGPTFTGQRPMAYRPLPRRPSVA